MRLAVENFATATKVTKEASVFLRFVFDFWSLCCVSEKRAWIAL